MKRYKKTIKLTLVILLTIGMLGTTFCTTAVAEDNSLTIASVNPNPASEQESFIIVVKDQEGNPFSGAKVIFTGRDGWKTTDANGEVSFIAPELSAFDGDSKVFSILASYDGYVSGSGSITVLNRRLFVSAPQEANENTDFSVSVTDEKGNSHIANVYFDGNVKTGSTVTHTAPYVDSDTSKNILANWPNYESASTSINIISTGDPEPATISGKVSLEDESGNYNPSAGVSVVARKIGYGSGSDTTDDNGDYEIMIENVPEDGDSVTYRVTASKEGYISETKEVSVSEGDVITGINFALDMKDDDEDSSSSSTESSSTTVSTGTTESTEPMESSTTESSTNI